MTNKPKALEHAVEMLPSNLRPVDVLGTNGGGFFNANASNSYENPTAITNLVQMLLR
jgi:K+-transporting ATPase A subunit